MPPFAVVQCSLPLAGCWMLVKIKLSRLMCVTKQEWRCQILISHNQHQQTRRNVSIPVSVWRAQCAINHKTNILDISTYNGTRNPRNLKFKYFILLLMLWLFAGQSHRPYCSIRAHTAHIQHLSVANFEIKFLASRYGNVSFLK